MQFIVEIESEVTPGTWHQVDDPHTQYGAAIMKAFRMGVCFPHVVEHLRVRRGDQVILGA